ncbi:hypothetical protein [Streptomyces wuyuanensis]|uniref:hypothetical protein n=1 Tax=Streptomyces wuyuanensis TaxID=1196353 RepID=UPI00343B5FAA
MEIPVELQGYEWMAIYTWDSLYKLSVASPMELEGELKDHFALYGIYRTLGDGYRVGDLREFSESILQDMMNLELFYEEYVAAFRLLVAERCME